MMEEKMTEVMQSVKPNIISWVSAVIGAALVWWTGLPPLGQALLIVQGADILTGLLCAVTGRFVLSFSMTNPIRPDRFFI